MKCPKCEFKNPPGVKFCGECGAKLDKICSKCRFANPPQFKFCGECGYTLAHAAENAPEPTALDEKIVKIQRYLPEGLAEKILTQKNTIEGEHKQVTVMFCDMQSFTALSERLGPEEAYSIMNQVHRMHLSQSSARQRDISRTRFLLAVLMWWVEEWLKTARCFCNCLLKENVGETLPKGSVSKKRLTPA